jgi:hypothetical protein
MFSSAKAAIVTATGGAATVYLTHGENRKPNGSLILLKYTPGTIATGADIDNHHGETERNSDHGKGERWNKSQWSTTLARFLMQWQMARLEQLLPSLSRVKDERIKVVVAAGGDDKVGSIEAISVGRFTVLVAMLR